MSQKTAIIVRGNIAEGFEFIGPFKDFEAASKWAYKHAGFFSDWIATLEDGDRWEEHVEDDDGSPDAIELLSDDELAEGLRNLLFAPEVYDE